MAVLWKFYNKYYRTVILIREFDYSQFKDNRTSSPIPSPQSLLNANIIANK